MTLYSFSRTKVMNDIVFIQQDQGYGMTFVLSAGLRLWNVILFIQQD